MVHRLEENVNSLVEKLMSDYKKERDIDIVEDFVHPNRDEIVKMIGQLQNIISQSSFSFHFSILKLMSISSLLTGMSGSFVPFLVMVIS